MAAPVKNDSIFVGIRVRPFNEREAASDAAWVTDGKQSISGFPSSGRDVFSFDRVFDDSCSTRDVYETMAKDIVRSSLDGINGTILAYGQTSTGKTHTMMGNNDGVIPLAINHIFELLSSRSTETEYLLRVSYLEIYAEKLFDLLNPENEPVVRAAPPTSSSGDQEALNGQVIKGLEEKPVQSAEEVMAWMHAGEQNRRVGHTAMNHLSSRSHAIFRLVIESRQRIDETASDVRVSMLTLVDLAGSENTKKAQTEGKAFQEGKAINTSLLALSQVIKALANKQAHVPYRGSTLTRILQPALGGNARTAIICTVTLAQCNRSETHSTLTFAARASTVSNKPVVNVVLDDRAQLVVLRREIQALKEQLKATTEQQVLLEQESALEPSDAMDTGKVRNLELSKKLEEQEAARSEQEKKIKQLQALIFRTGPREGKPVVAATAEESRRKAMRRGTMCVATFSQWNQHADVTDESSEAADAHETTGGASSASGVPQSPGAGQLLLLGGASSATTTPQRSSNAASSEEYFAAMREKASLQRQLGQARTQNEQLEMVVAQQKELIEQAAANSVASEKSILDQIAALFGFKDLNFNALQKTLLQFRDTAIQLQQYSRQQSKTSEEMKARIAELQAALDASKERCGQLEQQASERDQQYVELEQETARQLAVLQVEHCRQLADIEGVCQEQGAEIQELQEALIVEKTRVAEAALQSKSTAASGTDGEGFDAHARRRQSVGPNRRMTLARPTILDGQPGSLPPGETGDLQAANKELRNQVASLSAELKSVQVELVRVQGQLDASTKKQRSFETKYRASLQSCESLQQENKRLEQQLREVTRVKKCTDREQEKQKSVNDQMKELRKQNQSVQESLAEANARATQAASELCALLQAKDELEARFDEVVKERNELKATLAQTVEQRQAVEAALASAQEETKTLQQRLVEGEKKYQVSMKLHNSTVDELKEAQIVLATLELQLDQQRSENNIQEVGLEHMRSTAKLLIETQTELRRVQAEFQAFKDSHSEADHYEIEELRGSVAELEQREEELTAQLREKETELTALQSELNQQLTDAKQRSQRKLKKLRVQIDEMSHKMRETELAVAEERRVLADQRRRFERNAESSSSAKDLLHEKEDLKRENSSLREEVEVFERSMKDLISEVTAIKQKNAEQARHIEELQKASSMTPAVAAAAPALVHDSSAAMLTQKENFEAEEQRLRTAFDAQKAETLRYKRKLTELVRAAKTLNVANRENMLTIQKLMQERCQLSEQLAMLSK